LQRFVTCHDLIFLLLITDDMPYLLQVWQFPARIYLYRTLGEYTPW